MKIALTTYALHVGGLETFVLSLAAGLVRAGHEVEVVTTDERGAWFERPEALGARVHFINGLNRQSRAAHARRAGLFLAAGKFDAVINNHSWFVQAALGMLPAETAAISVIHNSVEPVISLACANEPACDALVAPSPATSALARSRVHDPEKIHLIPHGVEVCDKSPELRNADPLRVVFCGCLYHKQKGIFFLPEIARRVLDSGVMLEMEVIGDGPDREEFVRLTSGQGLSKQIRVLGPLDHGVALDHIRRADALLLPSFYEGLPFVPLEAVARGTIPVMSLLPGITDAIVEDGVSGFLPKPGDVEGFARSLVTLARDTELRRRMSLAAWHQARERFSVENMVKGYLDLITAERTGPKRRHGLPRLAPDMVYWKDYIPNGLRRALGRLR